ncbi:hypothetical protein UFOVP274_15 [uncultured Caudovirales phage]|uniref:Uncharacterized protein n=1 Tax=uncultured Caudovirales phage TaxID=2100421 RepID=A0A6J5LM62_9CAUD|nr:hypothetical protein UFOVP274_15 [uncultured Caudovirales phage]
MAVNLSPVAGAAQQFFSNAGVPLAGGLLVRNDTEAPELDQYLVVPEPTNPVRVWL